MSASILGAVVAGALLAGQPAASPAWQSDYFQAQTQAASQKKPIAVVFGSGANAWAKISRDGAPTAEVAKQFGNYLCVYVDTTTPAGRKLANQFGIEGAQGIVLSDRTGALQAFWHQGDMTNSNLAASLQRYADPQRAATRTETATSSRTSFYPANNEIDWSGTAGGSSYCPSCNNVRGRR